MSIKISNIEYIILRVIRKFIFTTNLLNYIGRFVPYYQTNKNQVFPNQIVTTYQKYLNQLSQNICAKNVLEIGTGATNSTGYELVALYKCNYWGLEPFVDFNKKADNKLLTLIKAKYPYIELSKVTRIQQIEQIPDNSIDTILSYSVLEHVADIKTLFDQLKRVLKQDGFMLHSVDYRDHFFKYPYHFLQFSKKKWEKFLNPGDLPRWRFYQHLNYFQTIGFNVDILYLDSELEKFDKIKNQFHYDFQANNAYECITNAIIKLENVII